MKGDAGDTLIGVVVLAVALLMTLGAAGVPFVVWLAELALLVVGILMVRGDLGAHPRVGYTFIIAAPVLFILPGFAPEAAVVLPVIAAVLLWIGGGTKLFGLW